MSAKLGINYSVSASCPACEAITSFMQRDSIVVDRPYIYKGTRYQRVLYVFSHCVRCNRGGLATIPDNGNSQSAVLENFYPLSFSPANLPTAVPVDIKEEFREAEKCSANGTNRAASTLFRSVLEKTLKANGYVKSVDPTLNDLQKRIDAAAADGVITDARRKKSHDDIRSLGNDVLHDDWREVTNEEVENAHKYTQRILEDLYDDRATVEGVLTAKGRIKNP